MGGRTVYEQLKRARNSIAFVTGIADVKNRYASGTTPPDDSERLIMMDPLSVWEWDPNSSASDGQTAIQVGAISSGRFLRTQMALSQVNNNITGATIDSAGTPRPPTAHTHPVGEIQSFTLVELNARLSGSTLDSSGDARPPLSHNHNISDINTFSLAAFNARLNGGNVDFDTAPRPPTAHTHGIDEINTFSLSAINARLTSGNFDLAGTARPPTAHTHGVGDINEFTLAQLNARLTNGVLDTTADPRTPTNHTHGINEINSFGLGDINARLVGGNLDLAGTARPPTAHNHPYTQLTSPGGSDGQVLRVDGAGFALDNLLGTTDPVTSGGTPTAGDSTAAAPMNHRHEVGAFDTNGITVTGGTAPLLSAAGMATLLNGSAQTITSFGSAGPSGCFRFVISFGGPFTIEASGSINTPGGEDFVLPMGGWMLVQGIPGTNIWWVIAAWNSDGEIAAGLRRGETTPARTGGLGHPGNASRWAPIDHRHDAGNVTSVTLNSNSLPLGATGGDTIVIENGSSSTITSFGSVTQSRRFFVFEDELSVFGFGTGIVVPGSVNQGITVPPESYALVIGDTANGVWHFLSLLSRYDGTYIPVHETQSAAENMTGSYYRQSGRYYHYEQQNLEPVWIGA